MRFKVYLFDRKSKCLNTIRQIKIVSFGTISDRNNNIPTVGDSN